ncbi:hypothetical protein [Agrococcus sp. ARC_14]|uniref:hypothetical protein n=1 Tax=Agrococcus sp. ARC_14 TaxID=2919927 RepID=UPI001F055BEE|nr:hypothetical protein [Agrococcus sp. ARC_14]MCH1882260.1 hypothetical protein [Agrococcus sp. ARC_14]
MRTAARWVAAAGVAAVVGLAATGCVLPPHLDDPDMPCAALHPRCSVTPVADISRAEASQAQAIPDFDTATYVIEDAAELDRLEILLTDAGILGDYRSSGDACPGSITTDIAYVSAGATHTLEIRTCEPTEFDEAVTDLASEWRTSGDFATAP